MEEVLRETAAGVLIKVQVLPRSSYSGIVGLQNGVVKIKLSAPPLEGRANEECVQIIAKSLRVSKGDVEIVAGHKGRSKTILLHGIDGRMFAGFFKSDGKFEADGK